MRTASSIAVLLLGSALYAAPGEAAPEALPENEEARAEKLGRIKPVVITGSRNPERPEDDVIHVETISGDYLSSSGSSNMADALSYQPGMYVSYDAAKGETVQMGGLPPDYSLILINGRRVIGKNDGATNLSRLNLTDIDRIEIIKGSSSVIYGSEAIGGVVNIITRPVSAPFEYKVVGGGGELGKLNVDAMAGNKVGIFSNKLDASFRQLEKYPISSADPKLMGRGFGNWQVFDQMQFQVSKDWEVGADMLGVYRRESGVNRSGTAYLNENKDSQLTGGTLYSRSKLTEAQQLNVDVSYSYFFDRYFQDFVNPVTKDVTTDTKEFYGSSLIHYNYNWMSNQSLTLGTENIWERIDSDRMQVTTVGNVPTRERTRNALYAENKWVILRDYNLILQPGVRYDFTSTSRDAVSPRIGVRIDPVRDITLKAGYGWGFRAPTLKEMNYDFVQGTTRILGNSELKPEVSRTYNAGIAYRATQRLTFSVNGYYHQISDKINRMLDRVIGATQYFVHTNVDAVESTVGEVGSELRFLKYFSVKLGYAYTDARDRTSGRTLDGQARHTGSATFSFMHHRYGLNVSLSAFGVGERPFYNKTTRLTEYRSPYTDLQFRITKSVGFNTSLFVSGENLTNEFNESTLVRPPRSFWAGVIIQNF